MGGVKSRWGIIGWGKIKGGVKPWWGIIGWGIVGGTKFNTRSYYIGIYFAVLLALALHRHVEPCQQDKEKFLSRCDIQFLSKRQRECSLTYKAP